MGNNGIGKSSILEALDAYFNDKSWNLNTATKKSGLKSTNPEVVPIFLVEKAEIPSEYELIAKLLDVVAKNIKIDNLAQQPQIDFDKHFKSIVKYNRHNLDEYYLLPIGLTYNGDLSLSFFNNKDLVDLYYSHEFFLNKAPSNKRPDQSKLDEELSDFKGLLTFLKNKIDYIYIPREIDPELFTKLEENEIQVLMGESLEKILERRVTQGQIKRINKNLNIFINEIADELDEYSYRTLTDRQQNLKRADVNNLIIQAFFGIRKLHKRQGSNWLDINSLSSGEKQRAIINIAYKLLTNHRASGEDLIIAVDEPESSLHISACYDQFNTLYEMSRECRQVIFSTHWYGFLPTVESGSATFINKNENTHQFDQVNLASYREQIRQMRSESKGVLPFDVRLKSLNDLVQSIISSTTSDSPYNWLICEGSSEKIYLSKYFNDLVTERKLRIVPVGGAHEIKRLYDYLSTAYSDFKNEIKGKIYLLSDTDSELVRYEISNENRLQCKRMVSDLNNKKTKLVKINANPSSPETEIEHVLNGKAFFETLLTFKEDYNDFLGFLDEYNSEDVEEVCSRSALDLRHSEISMVEQFFDLEGVKFKFSKKYCEIIDDSYLVPDWVNEIREYFME